MTRRTGMTAEATIELDRDDSAPSASEPLSQMVYRITSSEYGPADITEQALRSTLFGDRQPLGSMGFLARIGDPVAAVRDLRLSEEVLRPVLRPLITEVLVGSGRASRVNSVRLGPSIEGQRRFEMSWTPLGRDATAEPRTVDGEIAL